MGCDIHEMWQNRRLAKCCGSAVVGRYLPVLRAKVAAGRWNDITRTDAKIMVAACPQSTEALSATVPEGYEYKVSTTHAFEEGEQVGLVFRPEDIHVMKKEGQW